MRDNDSVGAGATIKVELGGSGVTGKQNKKQSKITKRAVFYRS